MENTVDPEQYLTQIVECCPYKLSIFWKSRLLRKHSDENEFHEDIKFCFGVEGNCLAEELTQLLKEKECYDYFLEKSVAWLFKSDIL